MLILIIIQVRQAVTQFLQQQQLETATAGDSSSEQSEPSEQVDQQINVAEEVSEAATEQDHEIIPEEERVTVRLKFLNDTLRDVEVCTGI